jgi:lysozyme
MHSIMEQLIMHEGLKLRPYKCSAGKLTIGIGRNLVDRGITREEAIYLAKNDIQGIKQALVLNHWYATLDPIRQKVIIDMAFNIGINGLLKFEKMILAIERRDFVKAADEMLDSLWAKQVGERAKRLAEMMMEGIDYRR